MILARRLVLSRRDTSEGGSDALPKDSRAAELMPWLSILVPRNAAAEDPSSQNFAMFCGRPRSQIPLTATGWRSCYAVARQPPSLNRWSNVPFSKSRCFTILLHALVVTPRPIL